MDYATYLQNLMSNLSPEAQAGLFGGAVQAPQGFTMPQAIQVQQPTQVQPQPLPTYQAAPIPSQPQAQPVQPPRQLTDIEKLYQDVLGRAPDTGGSEYWTKQFLADNTIDEAERKAFEQAARPELEINKLYREILGRAPDEAGAQYWMQQFMGDGVIDENERKTFELAARAELEQKQEQEQKRQEQKRQEIRGVDTRAVEEQRMLSQQNPMRPDVSNIMEAMQAARYAQEGFLTPQRSDLNAIRETAFSTYDTKKKAEEEAQQEEVLNQQALYRGSASGDYTGLTPAQIAFLENETPDERAYRMRQIANFLTPGFLRDLQTVYTTSDGTTRDISSLSNEAKAGLAAAQSSFGYDSNKDYYGD